MNIPVHPVSGSDHHRTPAIRKNNTGPDYLPRLYKECLGPHTFYMNYFETYVQRDLRQLRQIDNLSLFEKFVRLLAEHALSLDAIEIKAAKTFNTDFCRNPDKFQIIHEDLTVNKAVIHAGDRGFTFKGIQVKRWDEID